MAEAVPIKSIESDFNGKFEVLHIQETKSWNEVSVPLDLSLNQSEYFGFQKDFDGLNSDCIEKFDIENSEIKSDLSDFENTISCLEFEESNSEKDNSFEQSLNIEKNEAVSKYAESNPQNYKNFGGKSEKSEVCDPNTSTTDPLTTPVLKSKSDYDPFSPERVKLILNKIKINDELSVSQIEDIKSLVSEFSDVFVTSTSELRPADSKLPKFRIETGDNAPVFNKPRRVPHKFRQPVSEQMAELEKIGFIERSHSPWASSLVVVSRAGSSEPRCCVDYRKLNEVLKPIKYPLPRTDECLESLAGCEYISCLDAKSGYYQIPVHDDKEKTAFICHTGMFVFKCMPFGISSAPGFFQYCMDNIFSDIRNEFLTPYLDDLIIHSSSWEKHLEHLRTTFLRLREFGLKLGASKCNFGFFKVKVLGHIVSRDGISPCPEKIEKIINLKPPQNVHQTRQLIGCLTYYRRFIRNFSTLISPITELLKKDVPFVWSSECEKSLKVLKERFVNTGILRYPDYEKPFRVHTDSSSIAIGAVLSQLDENKIDRPIAFISRKLTDIQQRWPIREKEALSVVWACTTFRVYLIGKKFDIFTDHQSHKWMKQAESGKIARFALRLQEFDFNIHYIKGSSNVPSDFMSRYEYEDPELSEVLVVNDEKLPTIDEFRTSQRADPLFGDVISHFENNTKPKKHVSDFLRGQKHFSVDNETRLLVVRTNNDKNSQSKIVVPPKLRLKILKSFHDPPHMSHLGRNKTMFKLSERFYWPSMSIDLKLYLDSCLKCAINKKSQPIRQGLLQVYEVTAPFELVSIDILGPFPVTDKNNSYVLSCVDHFSNYPELIALPNITAKTTADAFVEILVTRHGCPQRICSDRGSNFFSAFFKRLNERLQIKQTFATSFSPQTNSKVERFNRVITACIKMYINENHDNWDNILPDLQFAYRTSRIEGMSFSPFEIIYGRKAKLPSDVLYGSPSKIRVDVSKYNLLLTKRLRQTFKKVREERKKIKHATKVRYDFSQTHVEFKKGDLVLLFMPQGDYRGPSRKLRPKFTRPNRVLKKVSDVNYEVKNLISGRKDIVHVRRMQKFEPCFRTDFEKDLKTNFKASRPIKVVSKRVQENQLQYKLWQPIGISWFNSDQIPNYLIIEFNRDYKQK